MSVHDPHAADREIDATASPTTAHLSGGEAGFSEFCELARRAFAEFLTIPTLVIVAFLLLAAGTYSLDRADISALAAVRNALRSRIFADSKATSDLLSTIATGIMTVTSITISLLLLAMQQTASSLTSEVLDQFLRRSFNQVFFGFFVGLSLFALITLSTVSQTFNPVFGATLTCLLTGFALYALMLLLYGTINQMRPVEIVETIHDLTLVARERQRSMVLKTRPAARIATAAATAVCASRRGFVTRIDVDSISAAAERVAGPSEVVLSVCIGSYVAYQDVMAQAGVATIDDARTLADCVQSAIVLERQRNIAFDPAYGIEQLETIAWTSISSSKSNPAPGLLIVRSLRDLLARWSVEPSLERERNRQPNAIVYHDEVFDRLMNALESLAVVSTESMQHQNFAEVVRTMAVMFHRLPGEQQQRAEELVLRIVSGLADHVLTADLDASLSGLGSALRAMSRHTTATAVDMARRQLAVSVGKLNSRSTRSGCGTSD